MKTVLLAILLLTVTGHAWALDICLPTDNDALLRGRDADFFQPTVEGSTASGMYGCFRRNGHQFHEGIDIKCLHRDKRGEPTDPIHAVANGTVAFFNTKPGLSNYGRYIVLDHHWDGVEVFTLYAHLSAVVKGLVVGQPVTKAQVIGTLGHSSNTREGIPPERAHCHFEIDVMLNPNFRIWYPKREPSAPPFGNFNGRNLFGMDPAAFLRAYAADRKLNFANYIARQPIGFTVLVGARAFPWLATHPEQVTGSAAGCVAYEVAVTAWGIPVKVTPRKASELSAADLRTIQRGLPALHYVNASEIATAACRKLVVRAGSGWRLGTEGREWVELLTYR